MELLKRYKELKAQGVNITLMELKKQMDSSPEEVGVNIAETSNATTVEAPLRSGFSALNSQSEPQAQSSTWTTSYYSQIEQIATPESYSGNISTEPVQNSTYSDNFNANFSWDAPAQTETPASVIESQPVEAMQKKYIMVLKNIV